MRTTPSLLAVMVVVSAATPCVLTAQLAGVDVKKVERFCDLGFRFTANGIDFNIDKIIKLGFKIDPKVLQAVTSQAAVYVAALTYSCRMTAAGFIKAQDFQGMAQTILQYAKDLDAVRSQAEKLTGTPVSEKPDPRLDPGQVAQTELGIKIEQAIDTGGELTVILQRLALKYRCLCTVGK